MDIIKDPVKKKMLFTIMVLFLQIKYTNGVTLPYPDATCGGVDNNYFFQHSSLECLPCGKNTKNSPDSLSCICANGFKFTEKNGGPVIKCQECNKNSVASSDGWNCVECVNGVDVATRTCKPCVKGVPVDRKLNGTFYQGRRQTCLSCKVDTHPVSLYGICRRCDQRVLDINIKILKHSDNLCSCPIGQHVKRTNGSTITFEEVDGICFTSDDILREKLSSYKIQFSGLQPIHSAFFKQHLRASQSLCSKHKNYTSCQLLANLCVMYMYNEDNYANKRLDGTDACKEYLLLVSHYSGTFVGKNWPSTMPWLYYDSSLQALYNADINSKFERRQILKFVLVSYYANGTFISISEETTVLEMCTIPDQVSADAYRFTTTYKAECKLKLKDLLKKYETIFYDLYLLTPDNKLHPVPVLVDNIQYNGVYINRNPDSSRWKLTRRFFLVDNLSGRSNLNKDPTMIQYASSIQILLRLRGDGLIFPPLLKVKYGATEVTNAGSSDEVSVSFQVLYEVNTNTIHQNIKIAVGVLSVLGIVYAIVRVISWRRRQGVILIDCNSIMIFIVYVFSALSLVFLVVLFATCMQWWFFFKQQTSVIRVLPTTDQEKILKSLFVAAFFMKFIDIIYMLYAQIFVDIFFIDWERPRGIVNASTDEQSKGLSGSVSIMRTLFVANEWRELQASRRINPLLLIMLVLFFLKVVGFEHWTTTDPINRFTINSSIHYVGEPSFILRLSVICLLYLVITIILWLIFGFIYERFVSDSIGDFIDFCSMSNISVFILSHRHFGYYIHGRSVHGRADTNLHELYEQFQREEDNLCGTRGLEPNSDKQTYEVAITRKFREDYDKILDLMLNRDIQGARRGQQLPTARQNQGLRGSTLPSNLECSVNAYNTMNRYLSSFIEHAIRENNYTVKDKFILEKLLQNELQGPLDNSLFYNDDNRSFTAILLYGQEWSLLIFNLMLFLMIDWLSGYNAVFASVVTYFFDIFIITIRDSFGKRNLARKTMVSERFLI